MDCTNIKKTAFQMYSKYEDQSCALTIVGAQILHGSRILKTLNSMQFNHEFTWLVWLSFGLLFLDPNLTSKRAGKF